MATSLDRDDVRGVYLRAFPEGERDSVSKLAIDLLAEEATPKIISIVAETETIVVGHAAFSPVTIDSKKNLQGYILAPLGVKPEYQRQGIGSTLIEWGTRWLTKMGVNILFVYGDPKYYSRFGFSTDAANRYTPPYELQYPFGWQAIALGECNVEKKSVNVTCVASLCDPGFW